MKWPERLLGYAFPWLEQTLNYSRRITAVFVLAAVLIPATGSASETVVMRFLAGRGSMSPFELANELHFFDGKGIEIKEEGYAAGGPEVLFALASGNLEIGNAAIVSIINSVANGNHFRAVYAGNGIDAKVKSNFYVLNDSSIKSRQDIVGATIAINTLGAHLDYVVREALNQSKLDFGATKLIAVPGPQLEQTLRSKQVDLIAVGSWQASFKGQLLKNGGVRSVFTDTDILGEMTGGMIVLPQEFIDSHPDATREFIEQSVRAADWAAEHPEEARAVFAKLLERRGENSELAKSWPGFGVRPHAVIADHDIDFWINILERDGRIPKGALKPDDLLYRVQ